MSTKETGGTAFPCDQIIARDENGRLYGKEISGGGMTLRDYFAANAMSGVLACVSTGRHDLTFLDGDTQEQRLATESYRLADAMLEARK